MKVNSDFNVTHEVQKNIADGVAFGKKRYRTFGSFLLRSLLLLVPGIILGHAIDITVDKLKREGVLGDTLLPYVMLQSVVMVFVLYTLTYGLGHYSEEFQRTPSGLFFVALFFGMQTNYISNLQRVLN